MMLRAGLLLLSLTTASAQIARTAAATLPPTSNPTKALKIAPGSFRPLEKRFDQRLGTLFGADDPLDLLGDTRGVYVEGFGLVFTTEASLIVTPTTNPFRQTISKELADSVRKRKIERLPFLKAAMKEMMSNIGRTFVQIPDDQQVVLIVRFYYASWEDLTGMPSEVVMRADRKSAIAG